MTKEQVLADISSLIQDIDKCTNKLVEAHEDCDREKIRRASLNMESLMVAAHQELTFLYDYINGGGEK